MIKRQKIVTNKYNTKTFHSNVIEMLKEAHNSIPNENRKVIIYIGFLGTLTNLKILI
tara:strand:- start:1416 stop:1586 length:171 start_codon:yes stop_codon:yes gene_type:complete